MKGWGWRSICRFQDLTENLGRIRNHGNRTSYGDKVSDIPAWR